MLKEEVEVFPVSHKYCFAYFILVEKNGSRTFKTDHEEKNILRRISLNLLNTAEFHLS